VIATIYRQRVQTRRKGEEVWGWAMAYKMDGKIAPLGAKT
jgi:hypothetical protein